MAARNQLGRFYPPGLPLPNAMREEIINEYNQGFSNGQIARSLQVSKGTVRRILRHYQRYGTVLPFSRGGSDARKMTDNVLQYVEIWKLQKPSTYASEIEDRLLLEGICSRQDLPSTSAITKILRRKVNMTWKKITRIPKEQVQNMWKVDEYLERTWDLPATSLHFFDEASVIKTTSNRLYGSSYRGCPAIEIQKYASNATYTVNLLHSVLGVDYFNVIPGASNGDELIAFFNYALTCVRANGLPLFVQGDIVIMDNCGFHHGKITETTLRQMLAIYGVSLVFQPPYSPHLNPCELCFHQVKQWLRQNEKYSQEFTQLAIVDAVHNITAAQSVNYFRHCGYIQ